MEKLNIGLGNASHLMAFRTLLHMLSTYPNKLFLMFVIDCKLSCEIGIEFRPLELSYESIYAFADTSCVLWHTISVYLNIMRKRTRIRI